eukprot:scaffold105973_cov77-Phaeocystis_antarctica.AAC.3
MNVLSALSKHTVLQKQALRQTQTAEPNSGEGRRPSRDQRAETCARCGLRPAPSALSEALCARRVLVSLAGLSLPHTRIHTSRRGRVCTDKSTSTKTPETAHTYVFSVYDSVTTDSSWLVVRPGAQYRAFAAVLQVGPLGKPVSTPCSALASTLHRERSQGLPRRQEAAECVGCAAV